MNKTITSLIFVLSAFILLCISCTGYRQTDQLKESFINPPDSARPGVYWYFMDGNISPKEMTADLESMKKAGIGYVLFLEVNVGVPRGTTEFLSDEWQECFTHAVRECERLGIQLILGSGPGWAGSGGPWVKPEQSMMHLVSADTTVNGPGVFSAKLRIPPPKRPFFGEGSLTPELKKIRDEWYRDVRVLAFPAPEDKQKIQDLDEKALFYRAPYTSQPGVKPYIPFHADDRNTEKSIVSKSKVIDLTGRLKPDGTIEWLVPRGKWTILRMGTRNNGAVTRPAPVPGLGFEADKFDTAAFRAHYEAYIGKLIRKVKPVKSENGGGWTMIHIDSWEMGSQNWSSSFIDKFISKRGYDPVLYLPVYAGYIVNSARESEKFLWDLRQTSSELIIENHAQFFKKLGRENGFTLSIEPYDMNPAADFDLGAVADVPMCEFWSDGYGFNSSFSCIEATSIAHITGKPVVAAEAFTADHTEAWKKYPGDMKNQGDWAFAMGINRIVFHTFAHKTHGVKYLPGMTMGPYGVHWDRGQTWWPMVQEYHKYLTRCQFLLSQGKPVADILYLTPEGAPQVFLPPRSALSGTSVLPDKKGYSFDGCSPSHLIANATVSNSRIVFPGGASYKVLVLPDTKVMTPELLTKIESLIKAGAYVAGFPPEGSPSLINHPQADENIRKVAETIWGPPLKSNEGLSKRYFNGTIYVPPAYERDLSDSMNRKIYISYELTSRILKELNVNQDFSSKESIRYTHRSLSDREVYFISNKTGNDITDTCIFRDGSLNAELWDAVTGVIKPVRSYMPDNRGARVHVSMAPWQSYFVVFYRIPRNRQFRFADSSDFPQKKVLLSIKSPWKVSFETRMGGPGTVTFDSLTDWSLNDDEGIRFYSGIAKYETEFDLEGQVIEEEANRLYIDLGKVKNIASVKVNGKDAGIIWTAPWSADVTGLVKAKHNKLEIEVANLWINRLIGDESKPFDGIENGKWPDWLVSGSERTSGRFTFTTHRFYRKDDKLSESGLLGPVRIMVANTKQGK